MHLARGSFSGQNDLSILRLQVMVILWQRGSVEPANGEIRAFRGTDQKVQLSIIIPVSHIDACRTMRNVNQTKVVLIKIVIFQIVIHLLIQVELQLLTLDRHCENENVCILIAIPVCKTDNCQIFLHIISMISQWIWPQRCCFNVPMLLPNTSTSGGLAPGVLLSCHQPSSHSPKQDCAHAQELHRHGGAGKRPVLEKTGEKRKMQNAKHHSRSHVEVWSLGHSILAVPKNQSLHTSQESGKILGSALCTELYRSFWIHPRIQKRAISLQRLWLSGNVFYWYASNTLRRSTASYFIENKDSNTISKEHIHPHLDCKASAFCCDFGHHCQELLFLQLVAGGDFLFWCLCTFDQVRQGLYHKYMLPKREHEVMKCWSFL